MRNPNSREHGQCFGRKKTAVEVTNCKADRDLIKSNGVPIELVAYYQKFVDEEQKESIDILVRYDRTLLVADRRRCEPKKFGGRGARARFQKSALLHRRRSSDLSPPPSFKTTDPLLLINRSHQHQSSAALLVDSSIDRFRRSHQSQA